MTDTTTTWEAARRWHLELGGGVGIELLWVVGDPLLWFTLGGRALLGLDPYCGGSRAEN